MISTMCEGIYAAGMIHNGMLMENQRTSVGQRFRKQGDYRKISCPIGQFAVCLVVNILTYTVKNKKLRKLKIGRQLTAINF